MSMYDYRATRDWILGLHREAEKVIGYTGNAATARERLLLLALVEFAPNIEPSTAALVSMTATDQRTVRRLLRSCEAKGLLKVVPRPGARSRYLLNPCDPGRCAPPDDTSSGSMCPSTPGTAPAPPRVQRPLKQATKADKKADKSVSRATRLSSPSAKPVGTSRPQDWSPTEAHEAYAAQHGLEVGHEAHQFKAHHESRGSLFVNWHAAFTTWLANGRRFAQRSRVRASTLAPPQRGLAAGLDAATMGNPSWLEEGGG